MIDDMAIRNMSPNTQKLYIRAVAHFSAYHGQAPDKLTFEDVRDYQLHLVSCGLKVSTTNVIMCALRNAAEVRPALTARRNPRRHPTRIAVCSAAAAAGMLRLL